MSNSTNILSNSIKNYDLTPLYNLIDTATALPSKQILQVVFQYTGIDALFNGIVRKNQKGETEICLRGTNCRYLNDPGEITYGDGVINQVILPHMALSNLDIPNVLPLDDIYITSFTSLINSLLMWNMYGRNGTGVALGFDIDAIQSTGGILYQCPYDDLEFRTNLHKTMKDCIQRKNFSKTIEVDTFVEYMVKIQMLLKNQTYQQEEEYRLIRQTQEKPKYRLSGSILIPFVENCFPKEALKIIYVGPCNNIELTGNALKRWLKDNDMEHVQIILSTIPYRII